VQPRDVTLIPFYRMHHQRYAVYWRSFSHPEWQAEQARQAAAKARREELERRTVDRVDIGDKESEADHQLKGEQTDSGNFLEHRWRHAVNGGWFSYQLRVRPDAPQQLLCTFWGSDAGSREFDILVEGERVATQTLANNQPGELFVRTIPIPGQLVRGKERVTVRFQGHAGNFAGGLFGLRVVLPSGGEKSAPPRRP
jgi:uncharacterized protein